MLLLFNFAIRFWFCSINVPSTNTKYQINKCVTKFMVTKRDYFFQNLNILQSKTPKLGSWFHVGKLMTDRKTVEDMRAATKANHVDVLRGWRILNHCCGTGGFAAEQDCNTKNQISKLRNLTEHKAGIFYEIWISVVNILHSVRNHIDICPTYIWLFSL